MSGPFGSSQWMYATGSAVEGQSLRFNDDDSAYLSWTPASAGNRKTWTWSGWVKRGNIGSVEHYLFGNSNGSNLGLHVRFNTDDTLYFMNYPSSFSGRLSTSRVFRDTSAWYHIVFVWDTTNATSGDRMRIYINGERETSFTAESYPSLNLDGTFNSTSYGDHAIGRNNYNGQYFDGYMAEVNFVDGTALDPTSFGETDANGQWVPIQNPSVTYGTNGFYLTFDGFNGTTATDESSNSNDWTANNLAATDLMLDHAQNNFATLGPMVRSVRSEGNLRSSKLDTNYNTAVSSIAVSSGKWYSECRVTLDAIYPVLGIADVSSNTIIDTSKYMGEDSLSYGYFSTTWYFNGSSAGNHGLSISSGDILGVALDLDSAQNTLKIYVNGVLGSTLNINDPVEGYVVGSMGSSFAGAIADWNFGQDSSFAGNEIAQGNVDKNGFGDFYYQPPAGHLALCTQNLPDPAINDGTEHFNTATWTGTGAANSITGIGFQPDFVWTKCRSVATTAHTLHNVVSGVDKYLVSSRTSAEATLATIMTSFDSDGFTLGTHGLANTSGRTYVGWSWKAGGTGVANTDGSISSTVSANQTAGFSIVTFAGGSGTVGHGLSQAPELIIEKKTDTTSDWIAGTTVIDGSYDYVRLNTTAAKANSAVTAPTSSVFTPNTGANDVIAYCFHSVEGYSKIGKYTGNGSTNGPVVYTGFRPAFVIYKRTDSSAVWIMHDTVRDAYNAMTKRLYPNQENAEADSSTYAIDALSSGFKIRSSLSTLNTSGGTYIYIAFAESPFKYSNAR